MSTDQMITTGLWCVLACPLRARSASQLRNGPMPRWGEHDQAVSAALLNACVGRVKGGVG